MKKTIIIIGALVALAIPTALFMPKETKEVPTPVSIVIPKPAESVKPVTTPVEVETQEVSNTTAEKAVITDKEKNVYISYQIQEAIKSCGSNAQYCSFINSVLRTYPHANPEKFTFESVDQSIKYILDYYAPCKTDMSLASGLFKSFTW